MILDDEWSFMMVIPHDESLTFFLRMESLMRGGAVGFRRKPEFLGIFEMDFDARFGAVFDPISDGLSGAALKIHRKGNVARHRNHFRRERGGAEEEEEEETG